MIIVRITGGTGNQLFQYATGRRLAHKLNTELKLDNTLREVPHLHPFGLDKFNINATFATHEEINSLKKNNLMTEQGSSLADILNAPDNTFLSGWWGNEAYFQDISDILRTELTLKEPLSPKAEAYKQKILSAECPVAMHFRHGNFIYNPYYRIRRIFAYIPTLERYCDCIGYLKPFYENMTVFVFSNNLPFIKENLHLDVPIEFVENCEHDVEELYLMSLCKHVIRSVSTFSWWSSWLNQHPDKKIFQFMPSLAKVVEDWKCPLSPSNKDKPMSIDVPFDKDNDLRNVEMKPIFSLCLVVNDEATTIADTLDSLLGQDYKYYEVIIIDNASTDGSREICRQKIAGKKNVTFKRFHSKVSNAKAWNVALDMAQGDYVSFLKGNERFITNALTTSYGFTETKSEVILSTTYLAENENGEVAFGDKKLSYVYSSYFGARTRHVPSTKGQDAVMFFFNHQLNSFLGARFFYRDFLIKNKIKFNKHLDDTKAELLFQIEALLHTKYFSYVPNAFYIAPSITSVGGGHK